MNFTREQKKFIEDTASQMEKDLKLADGEFDKKAEEELLKALENLVKYWDTHHKDLFTIHNNYDCDWTSMTLSPQKEPKYFAEEVANNSVVVLTANPVEHFVVTKLLARENGEAVSTYITDDNFTFHVAKIGNVPVIHFMQHETSAYTDHGSYDASESALKRFRPKFLVSLGVAFGTDPDSQQLGDVLISSEICSYTDKTKLENRKIKFKSCNIYKMDPYLRNMWMPFVDKNEIPGLGTGFQCSFVPLLSGGAVVDDVYERIRFVEAAQNAGCDVRGGEMEGWGLIKICRKSGIPWVVVKGICDWAACKNFWDQIVQFQPYGLGEQIVDPAGNEEQNRKERNDFVKDAIQMTAAENAYLAFKYLVNYSSKMIEGDPETPEGGWLKRSSDRLHRYAEQFCEQHEGFFLKLVLFLLVMSVVIFAGSPILQFIRDPKPSHVFVEVLIGIILFAGGRFWFFCWDENRNYPEEAKIQTANLEISSLDYARGTCTIRNLSQETLKNVFITWRNRKKKMRVPGHRIERLETGESVQENIYANKEGSKPPRKIIDPDILQIEYTIGERTFCHTIRKMMFSKNFTETIYRKENGKSKYLYRNIFRGTV